ncbi:hypothetical protein FQN60_000287 [Etheostoma spectabile]|uniref:Uncharacterized protein n=1 Tax=Etheostoma spectabile TaxID=54343 RepID=A0A5J5D4L6_9PERO|nr:hypothetical protein FQN60_000287 [Etheostoma spectabile]
MVHRGVEAPVLVVLSEQIEALTLLHMGTLLLPPLLQGQRVDVVAIKVVRLAVPVGALSLVEARRRQPQQVPSVNVQAPVGVPHGVPMEGRTTDAVDGVNASHTHTHGHGHRGGREEVWRGRRTCRVLAHPLCGSVRLLLPLLLYLDLAVFLLVVIWQLYLFVQNLPAQPAIRTLEAGVWELPLPVFGLVFLVPLRLSGSGGQVVPVMLRGPGMAKEANRNWGRMARMALFYRVLGERQQDSIRAVTFGDTHLSLSSLPTDESRLSESRSLSCEPADALLSESPGFSQGGGVGKEGGVRCRRFHGSWWPPPLKCCCALGPSLWPKTALAAARDSTRGKTQAGRKLNAYLDNSPAKSATATSVTETASLPKSKLT